MSSLLSLNFGRQLADLKSYIKTELQTGTPEGNFALYVYQEAEETGPLSDWGAPASENALRKGDAPSLAAVGYYLASKTALIKPEIAKVWEEGATRLSERNAFPTDRQTFAFRPIELFGISVGTKQVLDQGHEFCAWLKSVLARLEEETDCGSALALFCEASSVLLGSSWKSRRPNVNSLATIEVFALRRWLCLTHSVPQSGKDEMLAELDEMLLRQALTEQISPTNVAEASLIQHALHRAVRTRIDSDLEATRIHRRDAQDGVATVVNICRRFPLFARQILIRHSGRASIGFIDEYDVQDAMHALLRLHFDDVRAEEWTPSYAGNSSRIDFILKQEKIVIEIKMTRKNLGQKELANQLILDKARYQAHPDYKTLICFVFDPDGNCSNPAALEADLSKKSGGFQVIAVVAPKGT